MKRIFICSLKYSPGLEKEFTLIGREFKKKNFNVTFLISKFFDLSYLRNFPIFRLTNGNSKLRIIFEFLLPAKLFLFIIKNEINNKYANSIYLIYNCHPVNVPLLLFVKYFCSSKTAVVLHEPCKTLSELKNYGFLGFFYYGISNIIQFLNIYISDQLITVSPNGTKILRKNFKKHLKKNIEANILLEDKLEKVKSSERKYLTFVGNINEDKNPNEIIRYVNASINGLVRPIQFCIITRSPIKRYIDLLEEGWEDYLLIIKKNNLNEMHIKSAILKSKAILILHKTSSQSGVLPLAYSYRTPVIARRIEAFSQFIDNEELLLPYDFDNNALSSAARYLDQNFENCSENAYLIFKKLFSIRNFEKYYKNLID